MKSLIRKLKFFMVIVAVLTLAGSVLSQPSSAEPLKLKCGNEGTYPPFSLIGADGRLTGLEPELAREMCKRLNADCEIIAMEFKALLPSLVTGKIDIIVSQLFPKPERLEKTEFTIPILDNPAVWILPKGWSKRVNAKALKGKRVGVIKGGYEIDVLKKHFPTVDLVHHDNINQIRLDLLAGRLDLAYGTRLGYTINVIDKEGGENWMIAPSKIESGGKKASFSWAVQKGNIELRDRINKVLEEIIEDCTYTKIRKQFISQPTLEKEPKRCQ